MSRLSRRELVWRATNLGGLAYGLVVLGGCELLPRQARRVPRRGFLWSNPRSNLTDMERAAFLTGLQEYGYTAGENMADDLASAFATAASWPAHGVIVRQSALFLTERARIAALAARSHLPAMYAFTEFVEAGGLMSYGTSNAVTYRRAAIYVDKILRGAKPAELPVEQLTTVEFAVNVKAAQELGLTLPPDVAAQVTDWVS